jgi:hypothetical protein
MLPVWTLLTGQTRDLFHAEANIDDATWTRGRGRGLRFGLGAVHVYQVTNPVLAAIGQHAIAEAITEPPAQHLTPSPPDHALWSDRPNPGPIRLASASHPSVPSRRVEHAPTRNIPGAAIVGDDSCPGSINLANE